MKLNWYSPVSPTPSGIADFTSTVLPALRERFDVTVWNERLEPVGAGDGRHEAAGGAVDVYNIGNSFAMHAGIFEAAQRRPGILLMHDTALPDFFHHHFANTAPRDGFDAHAERHGEETVKALAARRAGSAAPIPDAIRQRLLGLVVSNALCCVVFSDESLRALEGEGTAPVYQLDLPHAFTMPAGEAKVRSRGHLIVFGYLGDNRRIAEALAAIAAYPRRDELHLDIVGTHHDEPALRQLITQLGLAAQVRIRGLVPEGELNEAIATAQLAVNLRYPSMGEASISQLRAWRFCTPTIVTPVGWYASLPKDAVLTAPLEREREALHDAFTLALDRPDALAAIGLAGRARLEGHHSPETFVRGLATIFDDWPSIAARWTVERLTRRAGAAAREWKAGLAEQDWQGVAGALRGLAPAAFRDERPAPKPKRFLSGRTGPAAAYVEAAERYVEKLPPGEVSWQQLKPYDAFRTNGDFFSLQYQLMNLLQAMQIRPGGRILEIGAGAGWVTEQLLLLGFAVDALEPSGALLAVAEKRVAALAPHHGVSDAQARVAFRRGTLENADYPAERFDAVIFYDALHHIIDEEVGLKKCLDWLRPGGQIGVVEGWWSPFDTHLEAALTEEMRVYSTLENPFAQDYLDSLLATTGFVEIVRLFSVNGFFPQSMNERSLADAAGPGAQQTNNLIARKPYGRLATTADPAAHTAGEIVLQAGTVQPRAGVARLTVELRNSGSSVWLPGRRGAGGVTLALGHGAPDSDGFIEAPHRHPLPELLPGDAVTLEVQFSIAADAPPDGWALHLVSEDRFWFEERGTGVLAVGR